MMPVEAARATQTVAKRFRRRDASREQGDKREARLRGASQTFARCGFFNARVADIARAAGVASGTAYLIRPERG